jgi:DUF971 family protein
MASVSKDIWPTEIKLTAGKRALAIAFDTGERFELPAELLRVSSPSAEVQGHSPDQRVTVAGKRNVAIADVRAVGNYAVQIVFDDGHDTGFYRWPYLYELGTRETQHWQVYLDDLAAKGLSRG